MSDYSEDIVPKELVDVILSNFYRVHNELGFVFRKCV